MTRHSQSLLQVLFVGTEALAWFIVLRVFGTLFEAEHLRTLASEIEFGLRSGRWVDVNSATEAAAIARGAVDAASGGAGLVAVLLTAGGAFFLMRLLSGAGLPVALAAIVGLLASFIALHLLIIFAVSGELRVWEPSSFGGLFADDGIVGNVDADAFVLRPDLQLVGLGSATVTAAVLTLLWLRFLLAGRAPATLDSALRSFGLGFVAVLAATMLAEGTDQGAMAAWILPYFVLGALTVAVAHAARAPVGERVGGGTPWLISVIGTLGVVLAVAASFALLALLDVQRALEPLVDGLGFVLAWLLIIALTPVAWVLQRLLELIGADASIPELDISFGEEPPSEEEPGDGGIRLPGWMGDVLKVAAFAAVAWLLYRLGRMIFRRFRPYEERTYEELRFAATDSGQDTGLGRLLRRLVPRRASAPSSAWTERNPAYRLFARTVVAAHRRRRPRQEGETPLEFGDRAGRELRAEPFRGIAAAFDRARYGRHLPPEGETTSLARALDAWELAQPPAAEGPIEEDEAPRVAGSEDGPYP